MGIRACLCTLSAYTLVISRNISVHNYECLSVLLQLCERWRDLEWSCVLKICLSWLIMAAISFWRLVLCSTICFTVSVGIDLSLTKIRCTRSADCWCMDKRARISPSWEIEYYSDTCIVYLAVREMLLRFYRLSHACANSGAQAIVFSLPRKKRPGNKVVSFPDPHVHLPERGISWHCWISTMTYFTSFRTIVMCFVRATSDASFCIPIGLPVFRTCWLSNAKKSRFPDPLSGGRTWGSGTRPAQIRTRIIHTYVRTWRLTCASNPLYSARAVPGRKRKRSKQPDPLETCKCNRSLFATCTAVVRGPART